MIAWFRKNWFLIGLLTSVGLGFLFPEAGAEGGWLRTEVTTKIVVAVLFFIRGLLLPMRELRGALLHWRLHLLVHAFIFVLFPLGMLLALGVFGFFAEINASLRHGFLFLAILPTTVSTAAAFTALANGNTAASVFNATLSNSLGVILVPLWMAFVLQQEAVAVPVGGMVLEISFLVVVPLAIGQAVRPVVWEFAFKHKAELEVTSTGLILFVIFAAFANSASTGVWREHGAESIAVAFGLSFVFFFVATAAAQAIGRWLELGRADHICLIFCGPQKTLAGGATIAPVIFAGDPALGLILLPLLFYHFIQLFSAGLLTAKFARSKG